jgi:hypothetical protein
MSETTVLLTFEWDPKRQVLEIHANKNGLERLKGNLEKLIASSGNDHVHLMTPTWGGKELTAETQSENDVIVNHVKIFKWEH